MESRLIISCKNLGYYSKSSANLKSSDNWDIRDLNLKFFANDRVRFIFDNKDQKEVLLRLFLKKLKPKTGSIIMSPKIHIYSDCDLWEGTDKEFSIIKNMKSKLFSNKPWFGGQRKNLDILIDRLDLGGQVQYVPINKLSIKKRNRLKILMIIAANTKVILIENLYNIIDEISFLFLKEWLDCFSGIVIFFDDYFCRDDESGISSKILNQEIMSSIFSKNVCFSANGLSKKLDSKFEL
tara:strand:- start:2397 stop:3110 length:714 start_codon:yes stop_codon:yes gene_type:complete